MSEPNMKDDASPRPVSRTLGDLVDEMAARRPAAEAIVFRDALLDYAALKTRADAFARSLLAVGVQHGDRVALLVTNRPEPDFIGSRWSVGQYI
jgi:acyl-CoA synthetase (AMP-forming)/AMP-acid ligase II